MIPFQHKKFSTQEAWDRYQRLQSDIVEKVMSSNQKIIAINAPTGIGKSLIGMMVGYKNDVKTKLNYLCTTKALQHQIKDDFPEAHVMMGRANYPCGLNVNLKADSCVDKCDEYINGRVKCEYYDNKSKMFMAKYRVLNTTYFLCEANFTGSLKKEKLVVVDEADKLEDELCGFIGVNIGIKETARYGLEPPKYVTKQESWIDWAIDSVMKLEGVYRIMSSHGLSSNEVRVLKLIDKLKFLIINLQESDNWIFNRHNYYWEFKPVWLDEKMAEKYLWSHANKFVLMSATLPAKPVLCWMLKLEPSNMDYIEVGHPYKVENRMVYYEPVLEMTYKNKESWWKVKEKIVDVLKINRDTKGIIHTCSYEMRDVVMDIIGEGRDRLVTHYDSDDKAKVLSEFKSSNQPLVFVSPSSERGISLDGDMGRFSVWVKVPWKSLGDKRIQKRVYGSKLGGDWYGTDAAMSIIQGTGRIVRSEDDWGKTYILDKQFGRLIKYLPEWFRESIIVV